MFFRRACRQTRGRGIWIAAMSLFSSVVSAAEIIELTGDEGYYRHVGEQTWQKALIGVQLEEGDLVETGPRSSMSIRLSDLTLMGVGTNSDATIPREGRSADDFTEVHLERGTFWFRLKRIIDGFILRTPTASTGIQGTDWLVAIDRRADGQVSTKFSVENGMVLICAHTEEGRPCDPYEVGTPVKEGQTSEVVGGVIKKLERPEDRIQWVAHHAVRLDNYPKLADWRGRGKIGEAIEAIEREAFQEAHDALSISIEAGGAPPEVWLLLADLDTVAGNRARALQWLKDGGEEWEDARFKSHEVRQTLAWEGVEEAREALAPLLAARPEEVEFLLLDGELARLEGDYRRSVSSFSKALAGDEKPALGWYGKGIVLGERDHYRAAREALGKAAERAPGLYGLAGERAMVEASADQWAESERYFDEALGRYPDDYVALTGLGVLHLKQGRPEMALDALSRAAAIEPYYARALLYTGVAYYQLASREPTMDRRARRIRHALDMLELAADKDSNDPLPYLMMSLIYQDRIEPKAAIEAAREAQILMPNLKSMDQLAHDRKGTANTGSALAAMGLENWAMRYAQDAYLPNWAGSHLFLADRYPGRFLRESELIQGYLADPVVFGASPRQQVLVAHPDRHVGIGLNAAGNDEYWLLEPRLVANGTVHEEFPWSWFFEGIGSRLQPGDETLAADAFTVTGALGARLTPELGAFLFGNRVEVDAKDDAGGVLQNIDGWESRVDVGLRYRASPDMWSWIKVGLGKRHSVDHVVHPLSGAVGDCAAGTPYSGMCEERMKPRVGDVQFRQSFRIGDVHEIAFGVEGAWRESQLRQRFVGEILRPAWRIPKDVTTEVDEEDRSWSIYLSNRWRLDEWLLQWDLNAIDYQKGRYRSRYDGGRAPAFAYYSEEHRSVHPRLGVAWAPTPEFTVRAVLQSWRRPASDHGLAPVATAGIPLDDQLVLPGGRVDRGRLQFEWTPGNSTFLSFWHDRQRVRNLTFEGNPINTWETLAEFARLRQTDDGRLPTVERIEAQPSFGRGSVHSIGFGVERIVGDRLTLGLGYVHSEAENDNRGWVVPLVPRHRLSLTGTWFPSSRLRLQGQLIFRDERHIEERPGNGTLRAAGWGGQMTLRWSRPGRDLEVEGYLADRQREDASIEAGLNIVWRH